MSIRNECFMPYNCVKIITFRLEYLILYNSVPIFVLDRNTWYNIYCWLMIFSNSHQKECLPGWLGLQNTPTAPLQNGKISPNENPVYDTKQSDSEAPVMLELWEIQSTPSLPSLPSSFWPGVVAPIGSYQWVK